MKPISLVLVTAVVAVTAGWARAAQPQSRPAFALAFPPLHSAVHGWFPARHSLCDVRREPLSYSWPVRPFRSEHPIRAFFGDPRTIFRSATNGDLGSFSFHNGVDIAAPDGTPVYPVFSGVVVKATPDEIVVASPTLARTVQYWHLVKRVWVGRRVRAYTTVLGVVQPGRGHVHLTEIDDKVVVNPLQPGHLMPYRKATIPTVTGLYIRDRQGRALHPGNVSGTITLAATAYDTPPLPLPQPWTGVSVTPAIIRWQLTAVGGRDVLPVQLPIDFSSTIPPDDEFDSAYDTGTYQNFPTVGDHYFFGARGEYVFNLTASALDTRAIAPGAYTLTVSALDTCGNVGTLTEKLEVARQPRLRPIVGSVTPLLPAPQWPQDFWTVVLDQARTQTPAFRDLVLGHALAARTGPAALLLTGRKGRTLGIAHAFPSWAAAYTEAERVARLVPGAYALDVHNEAPPASLIPMPGKPLPA
ncbi:MAG TPA: M23 family metallopeptidase [Gaiellaceae bacterium]|nr:M23 family metallopeptidase [Gaiellaceae bacterium]